MNDKIIVSNKSALTAKYGPGGLAAITKALKDLIAADAKRGFKDRLVFLDDPAAMKAFGGTAVTNHLSPRQNKDAIDAIFRKADPEYLLIVGAPDVVPHQDMDNPAYDPPDDPDRYAYGDLPYACDAPYSRDIAKFKGPTRVVGRLPDLTGAKEPSHLISLIRTRGDVSTEGRDRVRHLFRPVDAQLARVDQGQPVRHIRKFQRSCDRPAKGAEASADALGKLAHFINCHGGRADPQFYGEKGIAMPPSLTSGTITKKIKPGTVAAVECCYGAELYNSVTLGLPLPICQQYLAHGAYGYFGSTTIAYGPAVGNGAADLITQYFLLAVIGGASLGTGGARRQAAICRAGRRARSHRPQDPAPSSIFWAIPRSIREERAIRLRFRLESTADEAKRLDRLGRRAKLQAEGAKLEATKPTASQKARGGRRTPTVNRALANIAKEAGSTARRHSRPMP